jgi:anti-sigma-K factor RskA
VADTEFERGHTAGAIAQRLNDHDKHFEKINGSIEVFDAHIRALTASIAEQGQLSAARERQMVATAAALAVSEQARRDRSIQSWSPWQKIATATVALMALAGFGLGLLRYLRGG